MRKDSLLERYKVKTSAVFNLEELYKKLFNWFRVYGYELYEKAYQDFDEPTGKRIEIFWNAEKVMDSFVKFVIEVNYFITGVQIVEIEKEGIKLKTNKCGIEMRINAYLALDYDDKWSKTSFGPALGNLYERYIAKKRIDKLEGELLTEAYAMIDEIKAFVDINRI